MRKTRVVNNAFYYRYQEMSKQTKHVIVYLTVLLLKAVLFPNKLLNEKPKNSNRNKTVNRTKWTKVLN